MHPAHHPDHPANHTPGAKELARHETERQDLAQKHHAFHTAMHSVDPASLPRTEGVVSKFLHNLHGDADGFLLDGQQVHFPPHLSDNLTKSIKIGDRVSVQGLKRRGVDILMALSITSVKGKQTFDCAPDH
jgi:hypothetical protein